ncbi:hypothetical protein PRIPAC_71707 [Pristionchus pacificus]|uniref:Uncharacterized protein n=1 Tax=Pristionchus pacificus TaxID=54126 RepID=A0A2A6B534_PRIPA|nr:hypothetical protein PRIPAC_71707 [Pristionchus pacificus]|eukprot:PDM60990.1 hypothetical protein PRIPAC_54796 [Pristionchus pacificus]
MADRSSKKKKMSKGGGGAGGAKRTESVMGQVDASTRSARRTKKSKATGKSLLAKEKPTTARDKKSQISRVFLSSRPVALIFSLWNRPSSEVSSLLLNKARSFCLL